MRSFYSICFLQIFYSTVIAQSVTITSEPAPVEYYRMPDKPLPADYRTYTADLDVQFGELSKSGYTETSLVDKYLNLQGYRRVNKDGDIAIEASIGEFFVWSELRNSNKKKTKDKQGNTITKFTYSLELKYSLPVAIKVADRESQTLLDKFIASNSETKTWTSQVFDSLDELDDFWRTARPSRLIELQKELIKMRMEEMSRLVNNSFGYIIINDKIRFATIGKKKHPEYDAFQKNLEIFQSAFALMDADKPLDDVRVKAQPAIDFYSERAQHAKSNSKDEKKLKTACLYNQALALCWLEDFDTAESIARSIERYDTKNKDVRRLIDEIEYARSSLYAAGRSSRHGVNAQRT